jgi:tellurite resistance protein
MEFAELQGLVDRAIADKQLTRAELDEIVAAIDADGKISAEEKTLMESLRQMVLKRQIRVVD